MTEEKKLDKYLTQIMMGQMIFFKKMLPRDKFSIVMMETNALTLMNLMPQGKVVSLEEVELLLQDANYQDLYQGLIKFLLDKINHAKSIFAIARHRSSIAL